MQDNKPFFEEEFSGEFLDRAWDQMNSMLDKEMPIAVAHRTDEEGWKRYLLLFLTLGFGVFLGASMVMFWPQSETSPINSGSSQDQIYAASGSTHQSPAQVSSGTPMNSQLASQANYSSTTNQIQPLTSSSIKSIRYKQKSTLTPLQNNTDFNAIQDVLANEAMPINRSPEMVFQGLKPYQIQPLQAQAYPLAESVTTNKITPKHKLKKEKPSLGFNVGMLTENYREGDGFEAGLVGEYPLNEKFSVKGGIMYRTLTKNKRADYAGSLEDPGRNPNEMIQTSSFPVYSMQYVAAPVALNYKLAKKVKVSAGVDVAYLTRARIGDNPIGFLDNDRPQEIDEDLPAYLEQGMRRWDVSASVGVSYQPTDRIILGARYNFGMTDFTKNNVYGIQALNNHRFLKLGISYIFTNRS